MMVARILFIVVFSAFLFPQSTLAQAVQQQLELTKSGEEYTRTIRLKRIQSGVQYYDPSAPAPEFSTTEKPKPREEQRANSSVQSGTVNLTWAATAALVVLAILFLFMRYGGASSLVLRKDAANPKRAKNDRAANAAPLGLEMQSVESILSNQDRREALIGMAQLLIYKAVTANDLLLQRSWTARDVLRRMPKNSTYLSELKELVLFGELVHFGERPVSEEELSDFTMRAKPLLRQLST